MKNKRLFKKLESVSSDMGVVFDEVVMEITFLENYIEELEKRHNIAIKHSPEIFESLKNLKSGDKVRERFGDKNIVTVKGYLSDKLGGEEYLNTEEQPHLYAHIINYELI